MSNSNWNPAQLATIEEAREIAVKLNEGISGFLIPGNGVAPEHLDSTKSGIYIPEWSSAFFGAPQEAKAEFYEFRFNNGAAGVNVGLVREQFNRFPNSIRYVFQCLYDEVQALAPKKK